MSESWLHRITNDSREASPIRARRACPAADRDEHRAAVRYLAEHIAIREVRGIAPGSLCSPVDVRPSFVFIEGKKGQGKERRDMHCTVGSKPTLRANPRSVRYQTYRSLFTPTPRHRRRPLPAPVPAKAISAGLDGLPESHQDDASSPTRNERANGAGGLRVGNERWQWMIALSMPAKVAVRIIASNRQPGWPRVARPAVRRLRAPVLDWRRRNGRTIDHCGVCPAGPASSRGMVQKGPFSGNSWGLSAHSERSRAGAVFGESLVAAPGLQFWENRVYPRSSSQ